MNSNLPLVSFIVPCFNQSRFLYEAICSILLSYSGPKEIIIIDDCSSDPSTITKINEIKSLFPSVIVLHNDVNIGLAATRNKGILFCTGKYIQLLDADDLLYPGKINYQIIQLEYGNDIDISITDYLNSDETLSKYYIPEPIIGSFELSINDFLYTWERGLSIPIHCALFKKEVFDKSLFDETLRAKEDWYFWCTQAFKKTKLAFLNQYGAIYRQHNFAMTKHNVEEMGIMWKKATYKINELFDEPNPLFLSNSLDWYDKYYKPNMNIREKGKIPEKIVRKRMAEKEYYALSKSRIKVNNNKDEVFISIIIPVYNHFEYLSKCFNSLINQNYSNFEIICIDDNSSDIRVKQFLSKAEKEIQNITVVYNAENYGISAVQNQGIQLAKGEFVGFLDCDDYLASDALFEVNLHMKNYANIDYFFSDRIDVDENDHFIRKAVYGGYPNIHPTSNIKDDLLDGMVASHLKVIRKSTIMDVGAFDVSLDGVQDWDMALRISENGHFHYINKPLYFHRQHANSVTISDKVSQFRKTNIVRRKYLDSWFRKDDKHECIINRFKKGINKYKIISEYQDDGTKLFTPDTLSLMNVKDAFCKGYVSILDTNKIFTLEWINFVREYNSYFDLIIVRDPQVALSLLGYLWNIDILYFPEYNQG